MVLIRVKEDKPKRVYVPVFTLHDLHQETRATSQVPVILCTGCGHEIPSPNGGAAIQCRDCGKKMQIVNIRPGGENSRATS